MAKLYKSAVPDPKYEYGHYNRESFEATERGYIAAVKADLRAKGYNDPLTGEIIRFPVADGYAQYMIATTKPATLIFLALGDAYGIPEAHLRGLTAKDLREKVSCEKALQKIFGRR